MALELFAHPFSSYSWKVLIALWADETPFIYRLLERDHPENFDMVKRHSPFGQFPVLLDDGVPHFESTPIIEHLFACYRGANEWIPAGEAGRRTRFLDRFFDLHVMNNMQVPVADKLRPEGTQDPHGVAKARANLHTAYDWLEANLGDGPWAIGERFTLADCAAAPSLFYADWVEPFAGSHPRLAAYRSRLIAHPVFARTIEEARPYRAYFPLGAPDRD